MISSTYWLRWKLVIFGNDQLTFLKYTTKGTYCRYNSKQNLISILPVNFMIYSSEKTSRKKFKLIIAWVWSLVKSQNWIKDDPEAGANLIDGLINLCWQHYITLLPILRSILGLKLYFWLTRLSMNSGDILSTRYSIDYGQGQKLRNFSEQLIWGWFRSQRVI